ncbi:MAG: DUF3127 domain-containing protein [Proteobacteria bacterium]|nr:DUF3127 domain-containing protein [Pseudomonadota bacterium]
MEIKAKLLEIFETKQVTSSFQKREFVVEYAENPQYPEYVKFELIQDKCGLLDKFSIGQEVNIHFNLKGRKWTDPKGEVKYFNTLQAWRILEATNQPSAGPSGGGSSGENEPPAWLDEEDNGNPPF